MHVGPALGAAVCWTELVPTSVSMASPILPKPNAICSRVCCKSPARNKEKFKYLCWVVTLSIQAINDRLQQSLLVLSARFPWYWLQLHKLSETPAINSSV